MNFIVVEDIPKRSNPKNLFGMWREFMAMNTKVVKVELSEYDYKNSSVARNCFCQSIKRGCFPITVIKRGDDIYLVRRDM